MTSVEDAVVPRRPLDLPDDELALFCRAVEDMQSDLRSRVRRSMAEDSPESLRRSDDNEPGDTAYGIDRVGESVLLELAERHLSPWLPIVVVAEGLPDVGLGPGAARVPATSSPDAMRFRVIVDPIDGTRGLMYGKRSAWILTGVAREREAVPTLRDIDLAVQTEIPPLKQNRADTLRALRGRGASATRVDLDTGQRAAFPLAPSRATDIAHGFGQLVRGFPGARDVLAAIDDEVCLTLLGPGANRKASTFEDQYICTGGQLAELAYGHDRWVADLRPLLGDLLRGRGLPEPLCCHPYDICTSLIAEEVGVDVCGLDGRSLDTPLLIDADVAWFGAANSSLRDAILPVLVDAVRRHGLPVTQTG